MAANDAPSSGSQPSEEPARGLSGLMNSLQLTSQPASPNVSARERRSSDTASPIGRFAGLFSRRWLNTERQVANSNSQDISNTRDPSPPKSTCSPEPLIQHHCTSEECAAKTMFETTELLEIVLDFLDTDSVLKLRCTSRRWNETIKSSPTLRLHHFVRPQWGRPASQFQLVDLKQPGLSIELGEELEMGRWILVSMTNAAARRICVTDAYGHRMRSRSIFEGMRGGLGRRARRENEDWPAPPPPPTREKGMLYHEDLQVCQPPVLGMQAYIIDPEPFAGPSQPSQEPPEPVPIAKLHFDGGISLGFLAETTQSLLMGPKRTVHESDPRTIVYKAIVSFTTTRAPRRRGGAHSVTRLA